MDRASGRLTQFFSRSIAVHRHSSEIRPGPHWRRLLLLLGGRGGGGGAIRYGTDWHPAVRAGGAASAAPLARSHRDRLVHTRDPPARHCSSTGIEIGSSLASAECFAAEPSSLGPGGGGGGGGGRCEATSLCPGAFGKNVQQKLHQSSQWSERVPRTAGLRGDSPRSSPSRCC